MVPEEVIVLAQWGLPLVLCWNIFMEMLWLEELPHILGFDPNSGPCPG